MADAARPAVLLIAGFALSFLGGPIVGLALARLVAPASLLADGVALFMFPLAFTAGLQLWLGTALFTAVVQLAARLASGGTWRVARSSAGDIPSGSFAFVPVAALAGLIGGVLVGFVSDGYSWAACVAIYTGAGVMYGAGVWQLARSGYLPFPEPG